jgi:hypothetical protein
MSDFDPEEEYDIPANVFYGCGFIGKSPKNFDPKTIPRPKTPGPTDWFKVPTIQLTEEEEELNMLGQPLKQPPRPPTPPRPLIPDSPPKPTMKEILKD